MPISLKRVFIFLPSTLVKENLDRDPVLDQQITGFTTRGRLGQQGKLSIYIWGRSVKAVRHNDQATTIINQSLSRSRKDNFLEVLDKRCIVVYSSAICMQDWKSWFLCRFLGTSHTIVIPFVRPASPSHRVLHHFASIPKGSDHIILGSARCVTISQIRLFPCHVMLLLLAFSLLVLGTILNIFDEPNSTCFDHTYELCRQPLQYQYRVQHLRLPRGTNIIQSSPDAKS